MEDQPRDLIKSVNEPGTVLYPDVLINILDVHRKKAADLTGIQPKYRAKISSTPHFCCATILQRIFHTLR